MRRPHVRRGAVVLGLVIGASLWSAASALAHPLGNFTVNRYAGVVVGPSEIRVDYVLDLAEIPTFQAIGEIDLDGDEQASEAELAAWAERRAVELADGLTVEVAGSRVGLSPTATSARLEPGQGGLETLRLEAALAGSQVATGGVVTVRDDNELAAIGWREITLAGADGFAVREASVPVASTSERLRSYPEDLLSSPLDVSSATGSFALGTGPGTIEAEGGADALAPGTATGDPLAGVLGRSGPLVAVGLLIAIGFGAWHAVLPGHGKTLMAAAMVGSGARAGQAAGIAIAVALMHSASVIALGMAVLALESTFRPETLYPWLGLVSGLAALGVGVHLLRVRLGAWRHRRLVGMHADGSHHHDHPHGHAHELPAGGPLSRRGLAALAAAGGILPAPSALLVMLAAIQVQRAAYGVALVLAFSVGLATALLAIGIGALRARDAVLGRLSSRVGAAIPVASAAAIVLVGGFLTFRGVGAV